MRASFLLVILTDRPEHSLADAPYHGFRRLDWAVRAGDGPTLEKEKCASIREWWAEHGREYHQVWRCWTGNCRGD
jgi:hypothetical protein